MLLLVLGHAAVADVDPAAAPYRSGTHALTPSRRVNVGGVGLVAAVKHRWRRWWMPPLFCAAATNCGYYSSCEVR